MRSRTISILDLSPADEAAWRDLAARSVEPNPFHEVDFVLPSCRHLRGGKHVTLMVAEDADRFYGCLPVCHTNRLRFLSSPVIGPWVHLYSLLGTPLVAAERGVEAIAALLEAMRQLAAWPKIVVLELLGDDGPTASYVRRAAHDLGLAVHVYSAGERAIFSCQDRELNVLAPWIKRERRAKARQWRRLRDALGEPAVVDSGGDSARVETFLAMEASGWKGRAGTALGCRASDAAFYREVTERFRAAGRLHLYSLEAGGITLAMQTDFSAGGALFDWKVAYNEQFARYSPGAQLELRAFELACGDGFSWIDTCSDVTDEHQLRLASGRRRVATLAVRPDGRLHLMVFNLGLFLIKAVRKLLRLSASMRDQLFGSPR